MVPFLSIHVACVCLSYDGRGGWHRTLQISLRYYGYLVMCAGHSDRRGVRSRTFTIGPEEVSQPRHHHILPRAATSFPQYHILRGMFIPFSRLSQTVTRPSAPLASRLLRLCINSRRVYLRTMSTEAPIVPTSPSSVADPLGKGKYIQSAGCIIIG